MIIDINGVKRLEITRTNVIGVDDLIIDLKNFLFGFANIPLFLMYILKTSKLENKQEKT